MFERHLVSKNHLVVPLSGNMYYIDMFGKITATDGFEIKTTSDDEGDRVAWLYLWEGWKHYKLSLLVALTYKPIKVPVVYWKDLQVNNLDGDKDNLHPSNLIWKFPIGLTCKKYPGYAYIPGYTRYVININGDIIEYFTGKIISIDTDGQNYKRYSVVPDIGQRTTLRRHRALGLAWMDYSVNVDKLEINHINGIPGDDRLENLEWVTRKDNVRHALRTGLKLTGKEVFTRDVTTKEIRGFHTISEAAEELGISASAIYRILNLPIDKRKSYKNYEFLEGLNYKVWDNIDAEKYLSVFQSMKGKIGNEDLYSTGKLDNGIKIVARNLKTGKIEKYRSLSAVGKAIGESATTISRQLLNNCQPIFPGYIQLKLYNESVWREPEDLEKEHNKAVSKKIVLCKNIHTGVITEYRSARECAISLGLSELTVAVRLRIEGQKLYKDGLQFKRKLDITPWRAILNVNKELKDAELSINVYIKDIFTKETFKFSSIVEASKELNIPKHVIMDRKDNKDNWPYFNYEIKFEPNSWEHYNELDIKLFKQVMLGNKAFRGRGFILTDVTTGAEIVYANREQICNEFKIAKSTISELARFQRIFRNKWRFNYYFK